MDEATTIQFDLTPPSDDQRRDLEADLSDEERHGTDQPQHRADSDDRVHVGEARR